MNFRKALLGEELYKEIEENNIKTDEQLNQQKLEEKVDTQVKSKYVKNKSKKNSSKVSDELIAAQKILVKEFLPKSHKLEELLSATNHILNWSHVININFDDDDFTLDGESGKKFSRERFTKSPYFVKDLKSELTTLFGEEVFIKFLKSPEKNQYRLMIKQYN